MGKLNAVNHGGERAIIRVLMPDYSIRRHAAGRLGSGSRDLPRGHRDRPRHVRDRRARKSDAESVWAKWTGNGGTLRFSSGRAGSWN